MSVHADPMATGTDSVVWVVLAVAAVLLLVMIGLLLRLKFVYGSGKLRLRIDNQAGLAPKVEVEDAAAFPFGVRPASRRPGRRRGVGSIPRASAIFLSAALDD